MTTNAPEIHARRARAFRSGMNASIAVLLVVVILTAINWFASTSQIRLDLTRNKQYTVSKATQNILRDLKDTVTVTVYATRRDTPPDWTRQREELMTLLSEYRRLARGRINFVLKDPNTDSKVETEAKQAGIRELVMQDVGMKEVSAKAGYLGFTALYKGKTEAVAYLTPETPIEYQLTRAINKVAAVNIPVIGLLAPQGNPFSGEPAYYSAVPKVMEQDGFTVRQLQPEKLADLNKPDTDIKLLMVIDPEELSEEALYRIDQYVMNGGKLFVAAPGVKLENVGPRVPPRAIPKAPNINSILEHYGLKIESNIVEDWAKGTQQSYMTERGVVPIMNPLVMVVSDLGPTPAASSESVNSGKDKGGKVKKSRESVEGTGSPITDGLPPLAFLFPSTVGRSDNGTSGLIEVLARSSVASRLQEGSFTLDQFKLRNRDPRRSAEEIAKLKSYDLVVSVKATDSGRLNSRFSMVDPPAITKDDGTTETVPASSVRKESAPGAQVIVVGTNMPFMDNIVEQAISNAVLLMNVADVLTRNGSTVELRNKSLVYAGLKGDISDSEVLWTHILAIGAVPALLILLGLLKNFVNGLVRSSHRRRYGPSPAAK